MKIQPLVIVFLMFFSIMNFVGATDEPKLIQVTDSLGNVQTNSWATTGQGSWKPELRTDPTYNLYCSNCIIKIGDKITFTMTTNQDNLEYRCNDGATGDEIMSWSTSNTCEWTVQKEDYGQSDVISIGIRNANGLDYMGNGHGDDYTYMTYKVVNVNDSIPVTNSSSLDRENNQSNSGSASIVSSTIIADPTSNNESSSGSASCAPDEEIDMASENNSDASHSTGEIGNQTNQTQEQVANLSEQLNQTQSQTISLNEGAVNQDTFIQKIMKFLKGLFGYKV